MPSPVARPRRSTSARPCRLPALSLLLLDVLLQGVLERLQGSVPEPVEVGAQGADAVRVQLVEPAGAVLAVGNETRLLQHLQVLGDSGPGDRQLVGDLPHRPWTLSQELEDGPPGRVAQCGHAILLVSLH